VVRLGELLWLESVVEKLLVKHRVGPEEVSEVLENRPKFRFVEKGHSADEDVYVAQGRTDAGRYLLVYFLLKTTREALIISARDMSDKERSRYERK
jgi:uncharacterized DUF497 family protein